MNNNITQNAEIPLYFVNICENISNEDIPYRQKYRPFNSFLARQTLCNRSVRAARSTFSASFESYGVFLRVEVM